MHSIILTKPMRVLVVGGGKAATTKLKRLQKCYSDITCISPTFNETISNSDITCIEDDFYTLPEVLFDDFDLIYLSLPYPSDNSQEIFFINTITHILSTGKLLSVSSKPELGNFITPASRTDGATTVSVSTSAKDPRRAVKLAEQLIEMVKVKI